MIRGNFVGTTIDGTSPLGNGVELKQAIYLAGAINAIVGGNTPGLRNVVSGNFRGIRVSGGSGNLVQGNYVGTNVAGTGAVPNSTGIWLSGTGTNSIVGGTNPGEGNLISGNNGNGIGFDHASEYSIQGNLIGTNPAGTAALPNTNYGIGAYRSPNNQIGGTLAGSRNVISEWKVLTAMSRSPSRS